MIQGVLALVACLEYPNELISPLQNINGTEVLTIYTTQNRKSLIFPPEETQHFVSERRQGTSLEYCEF